MVTLPQKLQCTSKLTTLPYSCSLFEFGYICSALSSPERQALIISAPNISIPEKSLLCNRKRSPFGFRSLWLNFL